MCAAANAQLSELRGLLAAAERRAAPPVAPPEAAAPAPGAGTLRSEPCVQMIAGVDAEAKAITAGVSECLEKELSSTGQDDVDIAAVHELEQFSERAAVLRSDVALLAPVLPPNLNGLEAELGATREYVRTLLSEMKGRVFSRRERIYGEVVAHQHAVVSVPSDGDCFFWAAHVGAGEPTEAGAREQLAAAGAPGAVRALRARLAKFLRSRLPEFEEAMVEGCLESLARDGGTDGLRDELLERLGACIRLQTSGSWDGAQASLAACARGALAGGAADDVREACDAYVAHFERPGVFAERLHVGAMAQMLRRTIRLYYYAGSERTPAKTSLLQPAETFGAGGAEEHGALCLLHHTSGRHYDLVCESARKAAPGGKPAACRSLVMAEDGAGEERPRQHNRRSGGGAGGCVCGRRPAERQ